MLGNKKPQGPLSEVLVERSPLRNKVAVYYQKLYFWVFLLLIFYGHRRDARLQHDWAEIVGDCWDCADECWANPFQNLCGAVQEKKDIKFHLVMVIYRKRNTA